MTLLTVAGLAACSGGGTSSPTVIGDDGVKAQGQLLLTPSTIQVTEGDSVALHVSHTRDASFRPENVTWGVDSASMGAVRNGRFVALAPGTASVTARYAGQTASADARIRPLPVGVEPVSESSFLGVAGAWNTDSVEVHVVGRDRLPVPDATVRFRVLEGSGTVSSSARATDEDGRARVAWRLGPAAGPNLLEARVEGLEPALFSAEGMANADEATVEAVSGNLQSARVGEVLVEPLVVVLVDPNGNPVRGVTLDWSFSGGLGSLNSSELEGSASSPGTGTMETVTDSLGRSAIYWKLGTTAGPQIAMAEARIPGPGAAPGGTGNGSGKKSTEFTAHANPGDVASLSMEPSSLTLEIDQGGALTAVATDTFENELEGLDVSWSTGNSSVATVSGTGYVSAVAPGATTVEARIGPHHAHADVTVKTIVPAEFGLVGGTNQTAPLGTTLPEPMAVQVLGSTGTPVPDIEVRWSVIRGGGSVSAATTVTDAQGMSEVVWTLGPELGTQTAVAETDGITAIAFTAEATVGPPAVVQVDPATVSVAVGSSRTLEASVYDEAGNLLTAEPVQWSVGDPGVASVDATGGVTGVAAGSTTITVEAADARGSAQVEVIDREPSALSYVSGGGQSSPVGAELADDLVVRVLDDTGSPFPGVTVSWSVTEGQGTISQAFSTTDAEGLASARWTLGTATGTQKVRASVSGLTSVDFGATATPGPVTQVNVSPSSLSLSVGETDTLSADAFDEHGNHVPGAVVAWASSDPAVASLSAAGVVAGLAGGTATAQATVDGVSGSAGITITEVVIPKPGTVTDLKVTSATETTATLQWNQVDDGTGQPAKYAIRYGTPTISWGAAYSTEVTVSGTSSSGLLSFTRQDLQPGTVYEFQLVAFRGNLNVDAVFGKWSNVTSGTTEFEQVVIATVAADRSSHTFDGAGQTLQLSATTRDPEGALVTDPELAWSSSDTAVVTVNQTGQVISHAAGAAAIIVSAVCCDAADTVQVEVMAAPAPAVAKVVADRTQHAFSALGQTVQLSALAYDADGLQVADPALVWSSTDATVAKVDSTGLVTALAVGDASILVRDACCAAADTVVLLADQDAATLEVSPATFSLSVGDTLTLDARVLDANNYEATVNSYTWSTSNTNVATVDANGHVTAVGSGTVTVNAEVSGLVGMSEGEVVDGGGTRGGDDGTTPTAGQPIFFDDFDDGALASNATFRWLSTNQKDGDFVGVTAQNPRGGTGHSLQFTYAGRPDGEDGWAEQRFQLSQDHQELWFEYWFFVPANYHHRDSSGPDNNKFFRLWGGNYSDSDPKGGASLGETASGGSGIYGQWGDHDDTMLSGQDGASWWPAIDDTGIGTMRRGQWHQIRWHWKLASGEDVFDGEYSLWMDGQLKIALYGLDFFAADGRGFDIGYLMGWSNSGFSETTSFFIDDFKVYVSDPGW